MAAIIGAGNFTQIVDQLIALKMQSRSRIETESVAIQSAKMELNDTEASLLSLKGQISSLAEGTGLFNHKASSSDSAKISTATLSAQSRSNVDFGTYEIEIISKATPFKTWNTGSISKSIDPNASIGSAGFRMTPTDGTFTINGVQFEIDSNTNTLTKVDGNVQLTTDLKLSSILSAIEAEISDLASVTYDAGTDKVSFTGSNSNFIQLGSSGDTSNFLQAIGVKDAAQNSVGGVINVVSIGPLGAINRSETLDTVQNQLQTNMMSGDFYINDVKIDIDLTQDSLQDVMDRINRSAAKVTASYDPLVDRFQIKGNVGGAQIRLENGTSNFLEALGLIDNQNQLVGGSDTGSIARFKINGQEFQTNSNTGLQDFIRGVSFDLQGDVGDTATITVTYDTDGAVSIIKQFVEQYNSTYQDINNSLESGALERDTSLRSLRRRLYFATLKDVGGLPIDYNGLIDIGITRTHGSNPELEVSDETKLRDALTADPEAIAELFGTSSNTTTSVKLLDPQQLRIPAGVHQSPKNQVIINGDVTANYQANESIRLVDGKLLEELTIQQSTYDNTTDQTTIIFTTDIGNDYTSAAHIGLVPVDPNDPNAVEFTLASKGIAATLGEIIDAYTGTDSTDGIFDKRQTSLDRRDQIVQKRLEDFDARIAQERQRLTREFAALESTLSMLQSQLDFLSQQSQNMQGLLGSILPSSS